MTSNHQPYPRRWLGFAFISLSLLVTTMNDTILNVSLPVIAEELGASTGELQWIQNAYLLVFASFLLTMGTLSDRYGRKRFLLLGTAAFAVFSLIAGFTESTLVLIAARALQGCCAAIIMPSTLSLISTLFPEPELNRKAIAIWSAMFGLGVGIGPVLGGMLLNIEALPWKAIFFINIPFAFVAIIGSSILLPESKDHTAPPPDIPGVFLSIVSLFTLVFAIIHAGETGWNQFSVIISASTAALLIAAFLLWEKHAPHPMLPLHFFRNMSFTAANISMTMTLFALMGFFFFIPQFFQGVQYYSPLETGLLMIPQALISVIASLLSHRVVRRFGIRKTVSGGLVLAASGITVLGLILQPNTPYPIILLAFLFLFSGIDTAMPAATMSIMGSVPEEKAGVGSAMNEMTTQIGGALGIAVVGAIVNRTYLQHVQDLDFGGNATLTAAVESSIFSANAALLESGLPNTTALMDGIRNGFMKGLHSGMFAGAVLLVLTALLVSRLLPDNLEHIATDLDLN